MIRWDEYYDNEMKKIEKSKRQLEKAAFFIIFLITFVNVVCYIGASL